MIMLLPYAVAALVLSVIAGGLLSGVDRIVTARLQSRQGPPVLQPFYDVFKLFGKTNSVVNPWQVFCSFVYVTASALALLLFFMRGDLLLLFFILTIGAVFQVVGALTVNSPFSQIGAQRELLQMLTYEPILILVFIALSMKSGSFLIADIYRLEEPLLPSMPLVYVALGYALTIKLRKSPFDISASHHAHQEIVRGVLNDYSGPQLALLEIGHWLDVVLLLGICSLFWSTGVVGMIVLLAATYFVELVIDNVCARLTWRWMLLKGLCAGVILCVINLFLLYAV